MALAPKLKLDPTLAARFAAPVATTVAPAPAPAPSSANLTPAQLAALDRALTPAEQKIVDDWQEAQANAQGDAEEAKGGPKAVAVNVTPQGAVIQAQPAQPMQIPWGLILGVLGAAVVGYGMYSMLGSSKGRKSVTA